MMTATYSPDDNKLRLYSSTRLDAETFARVKAAGFKWAPRQELFVAPAWSPERADLLLELAGEIGDEDSSLVDRAEERAERFGEYSEKRRADYHAAHEAAAAISSGIPLGQPILVGHHSERRARKDAERIESSMRRAVRAWETSRYWTDRAAGAVRAAKYKERPDVRARRIKGLEADERRLLKQTDAATFALGLWRGIETGAGFKRQEQSPLATFERARFVAGSVPGSCSYGTWSDLTDEKMTPQEAAAAAIALLEAGNASRARWLEHVRNRLAYERAMLEASGWTPPAKPKTSAALPLLNYAGAVAYRGLYREGIVRTEAIGITRAELAAIAADYKGTRVSECGTHRIRTAMLRRGSGAERWELSAVYLTDAKQHPRPDAGAVAARQAEEEAAATAELERRTAAAATRAAERAERAPDPDAEQAAALREQLRSGVRVVTAPQLYPTPRELARQLVAAAGVAPGMRVLEPSAGAGDLVRAVFGAMVGADAGRVTAVELHPACLEALEEQRRRTLGATGATFRIVAGDFLEQSPEELGTFHRVVMNPPFDGGADIRHVRHALRFLKPGGRLAAIVAGGPRQAEQLRPLASSWLELPDGSFASAGTSVRTALLVIEAAAAECAAA